MPDSNDGPDTLPARAKHAAAADRPAPDEIGRRSFLRTATLSTAALVIGCGSTGGAGQDGGVGHDGGAGPDGAPESDGGLGPGADGGADSGSDGGFVWSGRNESLRSVPDRSWIEVGPYEGATTANGGVSEVPWAYDANSRVFVRVGGCTGGYTNAIGCFDLGTMVQTTPWPMDVGNPADRPGGGCNRGLGYDPTTKCLFEFGGASSGPCYGVYGFWRGDMAAHTWTQLDAATGQQGHVAVDTASQKIVIFYFDSGHYMNCKLYDAATGILTVCPVRPGGAVGAEFYPVDWWPALEYDAALGGTMQVGYMRIDAGLGYNTEGWYAWLFDAPTRTWTDLLATGLEAVGYGRAVLSYDPVGRVTLLLIQGQGLFGYLPGENRWEKIETATVPTGWSEMFDYDSEHNVHAFVGLVGSWGGSIWAFRYSNG
jgi:hypothetical protein